MTDQTQDPATRLMAAMLTHVPFDGWTEPAFRAAMDDTGIDPVLARGLFPRGALDLAVAYHRQGDMAMLRALNEADLEALRFRDRVALAVRLRLQAVDDKEAVRRGATLFALPQHAAEGARLVWETADKIWTALGDTSRDYNWYTKRATLSGVYSATLLYWLGDQSPEHADTWAFLDRRIDDVMRIEGAKARLRKAPGLGHLVATAESALSRVTRPPAPRTDVPGGTQYPR